MMECYSCGQDDVEYVEPGCLSVTGEVMTFRVCRNCDRGINEHTEGECGCDRVHEVRD